MPTNAKAVLFDFDGVILDTEWPIYQTYVDLFAEEGQEIPIATYVQCIGSNFDTWSPEKYLESLTGKQYDWASINPMRQKKILEALRKPVALPGVHALFEQLKCADTPIAVVSSSSHSWVDGWLDKLNLAHYCRTTVCRGDAPRIKPAPDLYLEAARQLNIAPHDCLVIEDSMNGILSAREAGCQSIAVPSRLTSVLDFSIADRVIHSLTELLCPHPITS